MRSKFAIYGHPLHPLLVALPIGLFVWAFASDIIYLATGKNILWYDLSYYTGLVAFVSALVAALPGFGDYLTVAIKTRVAAMATAHMLLNVVVVGLYLVAFILQVDHGALGGGELAIVVILHGIGTALLTVSGILGGEMMVRHHIAIVPDDSETERQENARHGQRLGV